MKWITRSHVHVDRVACPWLITRFIDSDAEFLFVPKSEVLEIAKNQGATPFDTPGAELHHRDDLCTFDVIIEEYVLKVFLVSGKNPGVDDFIRKLLTFERLHKT